MQPLPLGVSFALLSIIWLPTPYALAEDTKVARGTVVALGGDSLIANQAGAGASFTQTSMIDERARLFAKGAGAAAAARGDRRRSTSW